MKTTLELSLVSAEIGGVPEKALAISRNLCQVDLIWPRAGIAKKTMARQLKFRRGKADISAEPWANRVLFREEVDGHCGLVVTLTEPVTVQKVRRLLRLAAKYALKQGADIVESALVGYGDIASAPIDALAQMAGEVPAVKAIARGILDVPAVAKLAAGDRLEIPLMRTEGTRQIGKVILEVG